MDETTLRTELFATPATRHLLAVPDAEFFAAWEDRGTDQEALAAAWSTTREVLRKHAELRYAMVGRDHFRRRGVAMPGDLSLLDDATLMAEYAAATNGPAELAARHAVPAHVARTYATLVFARHGEPLPKRETRKVLDAIADGTYVALWEDPAVGTKGIQGRYGVTAGAAIKRAKRAYAALGREHRGMYDLPADWRSGSPDAAPDSPSVPFGVAELNYVTSMLECGRTLAEAATGLGMAECDVVREYALTGVDVSGGWPYARRGVWNAGSAGLRALDEHCFDTVDTPAKAWLLGLLLADGSVGMTGRNRDLPTLELALRYTDADAVFQARDVLGSDARIAFDGSTSRTRNNAPRARLAVRDPHLLARLAELGIGERKSLTVGFPELDPALVPHLLRGAWDGDGSLMRTRGGAWSLSLCGSRAFLGGAEAWLLSGLGLGRVSWSPTRCPDLWQLKVWRQEDVGRLVGALWGGDASLRPAMARKAVKAAEALAWSWTAGERLERRAELRRGVVSPAFRGVPDSSFMRDWEDASLSLADMKGRYGSYHGGLRRHAGLVYAGYGLEVPAKADFRGLVRNR